MLTTDQKNLILYQAQNWIAETGYSILQKEEYSESCDCTYQKIFKTINYINTLQDVDVALTLDDKQQEAIYKCLQTSLQLGNYPVAGLPVDLSDNVTFIIGAPGPPGIPGAAGTNGIDANIDVVAHADGNITIITTFPAGVKTYTIQWTPYVEPGVVVDLDDAVIIDPDQFRVVSFGNVIASLQVFIDLTKGRNTVLSSTMVDPASLNPTYQGLLNLVTLNSVGSQAISIVAPNVDDTTVFNVNITDGTNTPVDSATVTFVYPYLYGSTGTTSTAGLYAVLNKLVKTLANQTVPLSGTVQYFWYGFPVAYGSLTKITDQNGFDVIGSFTNVGTVSVTSTTFGINNWTTDYKFYRTTAATTIPSGAEYTFEF